MNDGHVPLHREARSGMRHSVRHRCKIRSPFKRAYLRGS